MLYPLLSDRASEESKDICLSTYVLCICLHQMCSLTWTYMGLFGMKKECILNMTVDKYHLIGKKTLCNCFSNVLMCISSAVKGFLNLCSLFTVETAWYKLNKKDYLCLTKIQTRCLICQQSKEICNPNGHVEAREDCLPHKAWLKSPDKCGLRLQRLSSGVSFERNPQIQAQRFMLPMLLFLHFCISDNFSKTVFQLHQYFLHIKFQGDAGIFCKEDRWKKSHGNMV